MTNYITIADCVKLFKKHGDSYFNYPSFLVNIMGMTAKEAADAYGIDETNWWNYLETESDYDIRNAFEGEGGRDYRLKWAKLYAEEKNLTNGSTIKFFRDEYRNVGLMFWDSIKKEVVEPFDEIDDYGSVPPRFVVGEDDFDPFHWVGKVEHNTYTFPSSSLIKTIKQALKDKNDRITINSVDYKIIKEEEITDFDSIIIDTDMTEVPEYVIRILPGNPRWRIKSIKNAQKNKKNVTMKELKNVYESAPPSSKMSMGGPFYQKAKNNWNNHTGGKQKTRKSKTRRSKRK